MPSSALPGKAIFFPYCFGLKKLSQLFLFLFFFSVLPPPNRTVFLSPPPLAPTFSLSGVDTHMLLFSRFPCQLVGDQ